jgi:phage shock protein PspC (stress-responsive transcriptional regulator)
LAGGRAGGNLSGMDETTPTQPLPGPPEEPKRLYRSRDDRVIGGVCAGIARYFGFDPVIARVVAVALVFVGGAGLFIYLAAVLLVPDQDGDAIASSQTLRGRALVVLAAVLLVAAAGAFVPWGWDWFLGGFLVPLAFLALLGFGVWWVLTSAGGEGEGRAASTLRVALLGLALLVGCAILAVGAGWAAAVGGGTVVAILVIAAGVMLVAGAFFARVRWLIAPALAVALPLAVVAAAGIEVDGSVGERTYRPAAATDVRDTYELGIGSLVVDLRDADLAPGDHDLKLDVGIGEAVLLLPDGACARTEAHVGAGVVQVFGRDNGGVDVDWDGDETTPPGAPVVVLDADVGLGRVYVDDEYDDHRDWERGFDHDDRDEDERGVSVVCAGSDNA